MANRLLSDQWSAVRNLHNANFMRPSRASSRPFLILFSLAFAALMFGGAPGGVLAQNPFTALLGGSPVGTKTAAPEVQAMLFTQNGCPPCKRIAPMIDHLIGEGLPILKVDTVARPDLANQWQVRSTPTLVVVANGQEVQRQSGTMTAHQVQKMLLDAGYSADLSLLTKPTMIAPLRTLKDRLLPAAPSQRRKNPTASIPREQWTALEAAALAATVRIKVRYNENGSQVTDFGTGTVIHRYGNDILILTCGHLFREVQGPATIAVDMGFDGGDNKTTVAGQLLSFDAGAADVAFVSATTDFPIQPVSLARPDFAFHKPASVFSVGCDQGAPATVRRGDYLSTSLCGEAVAAGETPSGQRARKFDISGRPVVGRSGGGLFNAEGQLIGICNAAVMTADQGVYSSVENAYKLMPPSLLRLIETGELNEPRTSPAPNLLATHRSEPTRSEPTRFMPDWEAIARDLPATPSENATADLHRLMPQGSQTMRGQSLR